VQCPDTSRKPLQISCGPMTKLSLGRHRAVMTLCCTAPRRDAPGQRTHRIKMKLKNIIGAVLTIGLLAGGLAGCVTEKEHEGEGKKGDLSGEAKITRAQAEQTALAKVPGGTIKEGELEKEKGKLIWSFDIATPGTKDITEVAVDAVTGNVVAVDKETPKDEAKEKKKEKDDDDEKEDKK